VVETLRLGMRGSCATGWARVNMQVAGTSVNTWDYCTKLLTSVGLTKEADRLRGMRVRSRDANLKWREATRNIGWTDDLPRQNTLLAREFEIQGLGEIAEYYRYKAQVRIVGPN